MFYGKTLRFPTHEIYDVPKKFRRSHTLHLYLFSFVCHSSAARLTTKENNIRTTGFILPRNCFPRQVMLKIN